LYIATKDSSLMTEYVSSLSNHISMLINGKGHKCGRRWHEERPLARQ
jgi:hypothetical protein